MTIQEAIQSGNKFKRENWSNWMWCVVVGNHIRQWQGTQLIHCNIADLLANDWETQMDEYKIYITKSEMIKIFEVTMDELATENQGYKKLEEWKQAIEFFCHQVLKNFDFK